MGAGPPRLRRRRRGQRRARPAERPRRAVRGAGDHAHLQHLVHHHEAHRHDGPQRRRGHVRPAAAWSPASSPWSAASPGIGKSTLLLQLAGALAPSRGRTVLYVTGEESRRAGAPACRAPRRAAGQPPARRRRPRCRTWSAHIDRGPPEVVRGRLDPDRCSTRSSRRPPARSPRCASARTSSCRRQVHRHHRRCSSVTSPRTGTLAGPRVLEHVVDTVLSFEGDRHHALRLLRAVEAPLRLHRGARPVRDDRGGPRPVPTRRRMFLADRRPGIPGSVVVPALEGHRPLLVEVQALVADVRPCRSRAGRRRGSTAAGSRCCSRCWSAGRTCPSTGADVYAMAVGGVRVVEPGADLGDRAGRWRRRSIGRPVAGPTVVVRRGRPGRRAAPGRAGIDAPPRRGGAAGLHRGGGARSAPPRVDAPASS